MHKHIINFGVDEATLVDMDFLVEQGLYSSRASLIRAAVHETIAKDELLLRPLKEFAEMVGAFDNQFVSVHNDRAAVLALLQPLEEARIRLLTFPRLRKRVLETEKRSKVLPLARQEAGIHHEDQELKELRKLRSQAVLHGVDTLALDKILQLLEV